jgi:esterase/lipase
MRWHRPGSDIDLYDLEAIDELYSHGLRPMSAIHEFTRLLREVRNELAAVRAPVMVLHGGRDRTIAPANAAEIERRLVCSREVVRRSFPRSGHGMSVDVDREEINSAVLQWFTLHSSVGAVAPAAAERVAG